MEMLSCAPFRVSFLVCTQVLQDVSEEHARKTITIDPHPNLSIRAASIHPCRHSEVMKRLVDGLQSSGKTFEMEQCAPCPAPFRGHLF
jgi:ubiquitin-like-conjugating enzyme ATG3